MKRLFIALILSVALFAVGISAQSPGLPGPGPGSISRTSASYLHSRSITIDHTKVGSTDQTNFPVMFRSPIGTVNTSGTAITWVSGDQFPTWMDAIDIAGTTYTFTRTNATSGTTGASAGSQSGAAYCGTPYLKTVANGGLVQSSSGYDMVFSSSSTGSPLLDFERVRWVATTGEVELHFREATVSSTTDTVAYLVYDNAAITSDQANPSGVWNSAFVGVWHEPNGTTLTATDSTSNANNGTVTNATAAAGKIDGGASFNGTSARIDNGSGSSLDNLFAGGSQTGTIEFWAKRGATGFVTVISKSTDTAGSGWEVNFTGAGPGHKLRFGSAVATGGIRNWVSTSGFSDTTNWFYLVVNWNGSAHTNVPLGYVNGSADTMTANGGSGTGSAVETTTEPLMFGTQVDLGNYYNGVLDEIRISNVIRGADWITSTYNSLNSPFTFYTVGSQS